MARRSKCDGPTRCAVGGGPNLVIQETSGNETTTCTLAGVALGDIDCARDVIFAQNSGVTSDEDRTEFDDLIFGFAETTS